MGVACMAWNVAPPRCNSRGRVRVCGVRLPHGGKTRRHDLPARAPRLREGNEGHDAGTWAGGACCMRCAEDACEERRIKTHCGWGFRHIAKSVLAYGPKHCPPNNAAHGVAWHTGWRLVLTLTTSHLFLSDTHQTFTTEHPVTHLHNAWPRSLLAVDLGGRPLGRLAGSPRNYSRRGRLQLLGRSRQRHGMWPGAVHVARRYRALRADNLRALRSAYELGWWRA